MQHIGIINYNKKIIYIDLLENNLECYYYHNHEKKNISINTLLELLKSIFDKTKEEFLEQDGEYKIFINKETGYKHFYKDGKEDIMKFFLHNGENAILCKGLDIKDKYNEIKEFFNKSKAINITMTFVLTYVISNSFATYNTLNKYYDTKEELEELKAAIMEDDCNQYYDIDSLSSSLKEADAKMRNKGNNGTNLFNLELIMDICNTPMTEDRIMSVKEKTTDIEVIEFDVEDYKENAERVEQGLFRRSGYYNYLDPNIIHVESLSSVDTIHHEFVHLLQDDSMYNYIQEASAEIISSEYYGHIINSYQEEVKRIEILMEIIGNKPIWDLNFSGNSDSLEKVLSENLSKEDYEELQKILRVSPGYKTTDELEKINESFDEILSNLYYSMYNESIEQNEIIQNIYQCYDNSQSTTLINNRHYFQDVEQNKNRPDFIKSEYMTLKDAIDKNIVRVDMRVRKTVGISEDEYKERLSKNLKTEIGYNANEDVNSVSEVAYDEIVRKWEYQGKVYTTEEALEKGLIEPYYYYTIDEIVDYNAPEDEKKFADNGFVGFSKTIIPLTDEYDNIESYSYSDENVQKQEIVKLSDNIYISNENTKIDEQSKSR